MFVLTCFKFPWSFRIRIRIRIRVSDATLALSACNAHPSGSLGSIYTLDVAIIAIVLPSRAHLQCTSTMSPSSCSHREKERHEWMYFYELFFFVSFRIPFLSLPPYHSQLIRRRVSMDGLSLKQVASRGSLPQGLFVAGDDARECFHRASLQGKGRMQSLMVSME